jgi:hypothetical protein
MNIKVNGFAVLGAIAANARIFDELEADAIKAASNLALKSIKSKSTDLQRLREICGALGATSFGLIADQLNGGQIKTLLKSLDRHRVAIKTETSLQQRQHFYALAHGTQEPAPKPAAGKKTASKATISPRPSKSKTKPRVNIDYESAGLISEPSAGRVRRR